MEANEECNCGHTAEYHSGGYGDCMTRSGCDCRGFDVSERLPAANRREEEPGDKTERDEYVTLLENELKRLADYVSEANCRSIGIVLLSAPELVPVAPTLEASDVRPDPIFAVWYFTRHFLGKDLTIGEAAKSVHVESLSEEYEKFIKTRKVLAPAFALNPSSPETKWTDEMARLLDLYLRDYKPTDVARVLAEKYRALPGNVGRDIFDSNPAYTDEQLLALEGMGEVKLPDCVPTAEDLAAVKDEHRMNRHTAAQLRVVRRQLLAALKDNAELKAMFELHKALITKCPCAGIRFEGDDEPLVNERAETAEAELARLRGELKEREK